MAVTVELCIAVVLHQGIELQNAECRASRK